MWQRLHFRPEMRGRFPAAVGEIVLDGVTKEFAGGVRAVDGVDMTIADGEFMVLVGPSGCGKTTLLRSIGGLETITDGRIMIDGRDVTRASPSDRDLAMVFQNYALYPHMTVRQNLGYALRVRKTPKKEINRRVEEAAKLLGLDQLLDRRPGALSGGQMQRVAMGRAIVREPKAFLMDEPLSNLDAKLRVSMRTSLQQLHRRIGTTTVYVTHDQVEAMTLGARVAVMRDGKVQQVDAPGRLYEEPANLFVAAFIGSPAMNLAQGVLSDDNIMLGSTPIPLDRQRRPALQPGGARDRRHPPRVVRGRSVRLARPADDRRAGRGAREHRLRRLRLLRARRRAGDRRGGAVRRGRRRRAAARRQTTRRSSQRASTRARRRSPASV